MTPDEKRQQQRRINRALKEFPKVVARQAKRYRERQKFLKETFGELVQQVLKEKRKNSK